MCVCVYVIIIMFDKFETENDAHNVFNVAMTALIVAMIGVSQLWGTTDLRDRYFSSLFDHLVKFCQQTLNRNTPPEKNND